MAKSKDSHLRRLCLAGVISTLDYWLMKKRRRQRHRITNHKRCKLNLAAFTNDECLNFFRFSKFELRKLVYLLGIPDKIKIDRSQFTGLEAFCITLRRLSYPNRLCDLVKIFCREESSISKIANFITNRVFDEHKHRLTTLNQPWMDEETLRIFAEICSNAGSWYPNTIGFIDGTARPICRPTYNQREFYSGYEKVHMVKYQSVVFPNGLIGRVDGPFLGRRHDAAILGMSKLRAEFDTFLVTRNENYALLGDTGYSNSKFIKVGFKNHKVLSRAQKDFNRDLSSLRVSVE